MSLATAVASSGESEGPARKASLMRVGRLVGDARLLVFGIEEEQERVGTHAAPAAPDAAVLDAVGLVAVAHPDQHGAFAAGAGQADQRRVGAFVVGVEVLGVVVVGQDALAEVAAAEAGRLAGVRRQRHLHVHRGALGRADGVERRHHDQRAVGVGQLPLDVLDALLGQLFLEDGAVVVVGRLAAGAFEADDPADAAQGDGVGVADRGHVADGLESVAVGLALLAGLETGLLLLRCGASDQAEQRGRQRPPGRQAEGPPKVVRNATVHEIAPERWRTARAGATPDRIATTRTEGRLEGGR